jgi:hypothetical protein
MEDGFEITLPAEPTTPSSSTEDPPDMSPLLTPKTPSTSDTNQPSRPRRKEIRKAIESAKRDLQILQLALDSLPPDSDEEDANRTPSVVFPDSDLPLSPPAHVPAPFPKSVPSLQPQPAICERGGTLPLPQKIPSPRIDIRPEHHLAVKHAVRSLPRSLQQHRLRYTMLRPPHLCPSAPRSLPTPSLARSLPFVASSLVVSRPAPPLLARWLARPLPLPLTPSDPTQSFFSSSPFPRVAGDRGGYPPVRLTPLHGISRHSSAHLLTSPRAVRAGLPSVLGLPTMREHGADNARIEGWRPFAVRRRDAGAVLTIRFATHGRAGPGRPRAGGRACWGASPPRAPRRCATHDSCDKSIHDSCNTVGSACSAQGVSGTSADEPAGERPLAPRRCSI